MRGGGVKAILQYVEIKTAEFLGAIELQLAHDQVELVPAVAGPHIREITIGDAKLVAVQLEQFGHGDGIPLRVEVGGIREKEAQRITNAPIAFDDPLEDFVGNGKVAGIVRRADPQSQDLGAERVPYLLRRHDV